MTRTCDSDHFHLHQALSKPSHHMDGGTVLLEETSPVRITAFHFEKKVRTTLSPFLKLLFRPLLLKTGDSV